MSAWFPAVEAAFLLYFLALNSCYAALLVLSVPEIWEQTRLAEDEDLQRLMQSDALPPITLLVPAHNEGATIETSVTALLALEYRQFEVVVVNDGSKDDTMDRLRTAFDLYEIPRTYPESLPTRPVRGLYKSRTRTRLVVIDKDNGGKADALNAAINASRWPLVIAVDADTLIEHDALLRLTRPFLLGRRVAAVGGTVRVVNACTVQDGRVLRARVPRRFLPGVQVVEYLRAFLFGRLGWNRVGGNLIISGAFGLFRREYLLAIGGYRTDSVVEDLDVVVRLHRWLRARGEPYAMPFIPDPVAWTEVPESTRILSRQRERWHRGLIAAMWQYKTMLFNPRYGVIGLCTMPFFFFGEMLAPLVEAAGLVLTVAGLAFGVIDWTFALLFLAVAWGYGMMLSLWAVVLEEASFRRYREPGDLARLLGFAALENFGYRQATVWWRLRAFVGVFRRGHAWGEMVRRGFKGAALLAGLTVVAAPLAAQDVRVAGWGAWEAVHNSDDWTLLGGRATWATARGDALFAGAERTGRFGEADLTVHGGGVLHPAPRLWLTATLAGADAPAVVARNTWEADATARVATPVTLGFGYRRSNYSAGAVDVVMPHGTVTTGRVEWEARLYISRPPADRTDLAVLVRAALPLGRRVAGWVGVGAGRESFLVGAPPVQQVRSLETRTATVGARAELGAGFSLRADATLVDSDPTLSRRGLALSLERRFRR